MAVRVFFFFFLFLFIGKLFLKPKTAMQVLNSKNRNHTLREKLTSGKGDIHPAM